MKLYALKHHGKYIAFHTSSSKLKATAYDVSRTGPEWEYKPSKWPKLEAQGWRIVAMAVCVALSERSKSHD